MKKLLSMFLALCMVLTMLPVSAMAEEANTTIGTSGEIIAFEPLAEIEKTVTTGTSIQDLELPETLTATVRTSPDFSMQADTNQETVTDRVYDSEYEEILVDIPVTWTSQPEYDMDTEGEYLFTPMAVTEYQVWVGGVQVTSVNVNNVLGDETETVSYNYDNNTLTLNNANITNAHTGWGGRHVLYL